MFGLISAVRCEMRPDTAWVEAVGFIGGIREGCLVYISEAW